MNRQRIKDLEQTAIRCFESQLANDEPWSVERYELVRRQFKCNDNHMWGNPRHQIDMKDPVLQNMRDACYNEACGPSMKGKKLKKILRMWHPALIHIYNIGMLIAATEDVLFRLHGQGELTQIDINCIGAAMRLFDQPSVNWLYQKRIERVNGFEFVDSVEELYSNVGKILRSIYSCLLDTNSRKSGYYSLQREKVEVLETFIDLRWERVLPSALQALTDGQLQMEAAVDPTDTLLESIAALSLDTAQSIGQKPPPSIIIGSHYNDFSGDLGPISTVPDSPPASEDQSRRLSIFTNSRSRATSVSSVVTHRSDRSAIDSVKGVLRKGKEALFPAQAKSEAGSAGSPGDPEVSDLLSNVGLQFLALKEQLDIPSLDGVILDDRREESYEARLRRASASSQASDTSHGTVTGGNLSSSVIWNPHGTEPVPEYAETIDDSVLVSS